MLISPGDLICFLDPPHTTPFITLNVLSAQGRGTSRRSNRGEQKEYSASDKQ